MPAVLWVLAVGSYWTFAHRMYHTWRELNKIKNQANKDEAQTALSASNAGSERRAEQQLVHKAG
jgi:hypothetical protein